jgi:small-conductance mechanosensitive channel
MTMTNNGTYTTTLIVPTIEATDLRADLDALDDCLDDLNEAMQQTAMARLEIDRLGRHLESVEAGHILAIEGGNAEQRKARLTLALLDDAEHVRTVRAIDQERARLYDSERRITVAKGRARAIHAGISLRLGAER